MEFMSFVKLAKGLFYLIFFSFLMKGCKTIEPNRPAENYFSGDPFKKEASILNIPVKFDLAQLENTVNSEIEGLLFENNLQEKNSKLSLKVWKKSPIEVTAVDDHFSIVVPLKVWAKAGLSFDNFGISFADEKETNFEMNLKFKTKISIDPDWNIQTVTQSDGFEWVIKPVIHLGPVKMPLETLLAGVISDQQNLVAQQLDREMRPNLDIKAQVLEAWVMLQTPYQVSKEYNVWLKVSPVEILMTPLSGSGSSSGFSFGIKAYTETFIGEEPEKTINPDLPAITIVDSISSQFNIGLSSKIPNDEINRLLAENFQDQTFSFNNNKYQVTITDLELYGSGNNLVIRAGLQGSINGNIYLKGTPAFSAVTQSLYLENFDFDLDTKSALIKTASWLMHGKLVEEFTNALTIPLGPQLAWATSLIDQNLNNVEIAPGIYVNGKLEELTPSGVFITEDFIIASIMAKGRADISIENFEHPAVNMKGRF
jgi:hypothetical protein